MAYLFFIDNLATGLFSRKFLPYVPISGHTGPNDTGLMSVSYPGAKSIAVHTDTQTELGYYNIDLSKIPIILSYSAFNKRCKSF